MARLFQRAIPAISASRVKTTWKYCNRQQVFGARRHPVARSRTLTLRTMPNHAAIVGDMLVIALGADCHMSTECLGPVGLYR